MFVFIQQPWWFRRDPVSYFPTISKGEGVFELIVLVTAPSNLSFLSV